MIANAWKRGNVVGNVYPSLIKKKPKTYIVLAHNKLLTIYFTFTSQQHKFARNCRLLFEGKLVITLPLFVTFIRL